MDELNDEDPLSDVPESNENADEDPLSDVPESNENVDEDLHHLHGDRE